MVLGYWEQLHIMWKVDGTGSIQHPSLSRIILTLHRTRGAILGPRERGVRLIHFTAQRDRRWKGKGVQTGEMEFFEMFLFSTGFVYSFCISCIDKTRLMSAVVAASFLNNIHLFISVL